MAGGDLGRGQELALTERHALLSERLLQDPQCLRPDTVQFLQLRGWHIRKLAELRISGGGQRAGRWCPNVLGKTWIR